MQPHPARPEDADWIGAVHATAWRETYSGLLPEAELRRHGGDARGALWRAVIAKGRSRVAVLPRLGFAAAGPQQDSGLAAHGWPEEVHALYLLRAGQGRGLGRALFDAVRGPLPFTCWVLDGNHGAARFYERQGGRLILTRPERIGEAAITEHLYGWGAPLPSPPAS